VDLIKEKVLISKIVEQYVDLKQNGPSSFTGAIARRQVHSPAALRSLAIS